MIWKCSNIQQDMVILYFWRFAPVVQAVSRFWNVGMSAAFRDCISKINPEKPSNMNRQNAEHRCLSHGVIQNSCSVTSSKPSWGVGAPRKMASLLMVSSIS